MFGLVFSAFPKPPNTIDIQTEPLPALPSPPGSLLRWQGSASSSLPVASSQLRNSLPVPFSGPPPRPASHRRRTRGPRGSERVNGAWPLRVVIFTGLRD